jgi:phosphoserine phosphatase RsbU/P
MADGVKQAAGVMAAALEADHAFVTVFHCSYDPASGELSYVDAGHGHARLLRGSTGQELLAERSAPIGVFSDTRFIEGRAKLEAGDTLVVFSDGLLDLRPDLATKDVQLPHEARLAVSAQKVVDLLAEGARHEDLFDDVTVLALRRL